MTMPFETGLIVIVTALFSYLIGAIPFGFLIGKLYGKDIRREGSGNIGATNVTRVIGKWQGRMCFFLDFLKGALPVVIVSYVTPKVILPGFVEQFPEWLKAYSGCVPDKGGILPSVAAFAAVCGHVWPVYLGFKGGKGVSTAAGAIFALNPISLVCAGLVWAVVFFVSRYVSLASIAAAASLPIVSYVFRRLDVVNAYTAELVLFCLLAVLTIVKHHSNIVRLIKGTENKFEKKK